MGVVVVVSKALGQEKVWPTIFCSQKFIFPWHGVFVYVGNKTQ